MRTGPINCACILALIGWAASAAHGWDCDPPTADLDVARYVCVGCELQFSACASEDPDCCPYYGCVDCPLYTCGICETQQLRNGIRKYLWDWTDDGTYDYSESPGDSVAYHTYETAGTYTVRLRVWDHDSCSDCGNDKSGECTRLVSAVEVDKIVEYGTDDKGPLYVCPGDIVDLEAKPNPSDASFPTLHPEWSIESQPEGGNAYLYYSWGDTNTLNGLDKRGEYKVKAKCGSNDAGDTIIVYVANTTYKLFDWLPSFGCGPLDIENQQFTRDDCDNWLSVYCDSENHLGSKAFSWWYNEGSPIPRETEVGCCVWLGGRNAFRYYFSYPGKKLFLATEQASCNDSKHDWLHQEGCWGYYCYRKVFYVCDNGQKAITWWRNSGDSCPCEYGNMPEDADSECCPGPPMVHSGWPY